MHLGRVEVAAELLLGAPLEASRRVDDLRPAAVVEGDEEGDALVAGGRLFGPLHPLDQLRRRRPRGGRRSASARPSASSSGVSSAIRSPNIAIRPSTSSAGRDPVLGREGEDGQLLDPELDRVAQPRLDDVGAGPVPLDHRQPALLRPAAVAVGDDRYVPRGRRLTPRGSPLPCPSAERRSRRSPRRSASAAPTRRGARRPRRLRPLSSARAGRCMMSRRTLRIAIRPSSATPWTTLTISRRRSSVSSGICRRITLPSLLGRQADVGLLDRFLDRPDRGLVERGHGQQAGVGGGDVGQLLERRRRAVVVDRRCGRAGAARRGRCGPWPARHGSTRPTWPSGPWRLRAVRRSAPLGSRSRSGRRARWRPACPPSRRRRSYLCCRSSPMLKT